MSNVLDVNNIAKEYKDFRLNNINFSLPKGFIMGLIGPNGAGKTTTIKLILNMIKNNAGSIKVFEKDNKEYEFEIKEKLGVVFDSNYFVDEWNLKDVEKAMIKFYKNWDKHTYDSMLDKFHLDKHKKVNELSKGMQMKLMLACAFSYNAELLILDEPTSGLDPVSRDELLEILTDYISDGERSVLFSTHITTDLDKVADYITYINNGNMIYTGGKDEFIENYRIIKGGLEELNKEVEHRIIGLRKFNTGFEGLIEAKDIELFPKLMIEPATIDEIIVFTSKGGCLNEK